MNKHLAFLLLIFSMCMLLIGCKAYPISSTEAVNQSPIIQPSHIAPTPKPLDLIQEQIDHMSIDEKIGQMMIVGLEGTSIQADAQEMIAAYHVGGFILYKDNMTTVTQTLELLNQLKEANRSNLAPLWLSVDQEGGKVNRMPEHIVKLPSARQVGTTNDLAYSYHIGQALGLQLSSLGFNMDFAPVLDINNNPKNPVIGDRSFGADAQTVMRHGLEVMKGIQSGKVAAVVKHFPGHGDTSVDSHLELPVVNKSLNELEQFELLPFVEAIKQHADAIMVAHLLLPKLDDTYPSSLSDNIITKLLRTKLGYDGVVITDDMTMGGIVNHYEIGEAAVRSVTAGSDILLIGHHYEQQLAVIQALKKGIGDGTLSEDMLDDSVYRILRLKAKYNLKDSLVESITTQELNTQIKAALKTGQTNN